MIDLATITSNNDRRRQALATLSQVNKSLVLDVLAAANMTLSCVESRAKAIPNYYPSF